MQCKFLENLKKNRNLQNRILFHIALLHRYNQKVLATPCFLHILPYPCERHDRSSHRMGPGFVPQSDLCTLTRSRTGCNALLLFYIHSGWYHTCLCSRKKSVKNVQLVLPRTFSNSLTLASRSLGAGSSVDITGTSMKLLRLQPQCCGLRSNPSHCCT